MMMMIICRANAKFSGRSQQKKMKKKKLFLVFIKRKK